LGQVTEVPIVLSVKRYTVAADSSDTQYEEVDLCPSCTNHLLRQLLEKNSYDQNIAWIEAVTGRKLQI